MGTLAAPLSSGSGPGKSGPGKQFAEASLFSPQAITPGVITGMTGMTLSRSGGSNVVFNPGPQSFTLKVDGLYLFQWWTHFSTAASFGGADSILFIDTNPTGGGDQTYPTSAVTGSGLDFMWVDEVVWHGGAVTLTPEVLVRGGVGASLDQVVISVSQVA